MKKVPYAPLPYKERIKHYTRRYFFGLNPNEVKDYKQGRLRKDMFSALRYIYGCDTHLSMNGWGNTFQEQLENIKAEQTRFPELVLSIGAGRGDLEAVLTCDSVECIITDPGLASPEMIKDTMKNWASTNEYIFWNLRMIDSVKKADELGLIPDTVVICETIEHITKEEFDESFEIIKTWHPLLVIVNYLEMHPIGVSGNRWNHIRPISDEDYDELCEKAEGVVFRLKSHLVLQL